MNESEKKEALQKVWDNWVGNITCSHCIIGLESEMHSVLTPNKRELNKLANDIFINSFIKEKTQQLTEREEMEGVQRCKMN